MDEKDLTIQILTNTLANALRENAVMAARLELLSAQKQEEQPDG